MNVICCVERIMIIVKFFQVVLVEFSVKVYWWKKHFCVF